MICLHLELSDFPSLMFFFFNDTATTEIYTLSLHDALPILCGPHFCSMKITEDVRKYAAEHGFTEDEALKRGMEDKSKELDRKSTRLNSSHGYISYAVFCLKKKKKCLATRHRIRGRSTEQRL